MEIGSCRDVAKWATYPTKWIKIPWFRATLILSVLSYVLWRAVEWAMLPGFWAGTWLHNTSDTALTLAEKRFGPVLLVKWWITDPDGPGGADKWEVLNHWGQFETAARVKLIIGVLWLAIWVLVLIPKLRRAHDASPSDGPTASVGDSGITQGPPSVS